MDLSKNFDKTHMFTTNNIGYVVDVVRRDSKKLSTIINEAIVSNQHKGTLSSINYISNNHALLHFTTTTQPHQILERLEAIERTLSEIHDALKNVI